MPPKHFLNMKIQPILKINDANCIHQFLTWEPLFKLKDQRDNMWMLNLDHFKSYYPIILHGLGEHTNKKTFFLQLIWTLPMNLKNHILFVCCKISPPSNQQLIHNHSYIEMLQIVFLLWIKIHVVQLNTSHFDQNDKIINKSVPPLHKFHECVPYLQ